MKYKLYKRYEVVDLNEMLKHISMKQLTYKFIGCDFMIIDIKRILSRVEVFENMEDHMIRSHFLTILLSHTLTDAYTNQLVEVFDYPFAIHRGEKYHNNEIIDFNIGDDDHIHIYYKGDPELNVPDDIVKQIRCTLEEIKREQEDRLLDKNDALETNLYEHIKDKTKDDSIETQKSFVKKLISIWNGWS